MTDILLNYGHITHQMKIICTFEVFSASCIRLFNRLSDLGVFPKSQNLPREPMARRSDFLVSRIPAVLCDCIFYKFGYLYKKFHGIFWVALEPH